jgi:hypothetical protein
MLALADGILGLALSSASGKLLVTLLSRHFDIARVENSHTDAWVTAFTLVLSFITGILSRRWSLF